MTYPIVDHAAAGRRSGAPQRAAVFILNVQYVCRRVAHRIVVPRREAEEVAAVHPGTAGTPLAYQRAAAVIGNDVQPWSGWYAVAANANLIGAVCGEAAITTVELQITFRRRLRCGALGGANRPRAALRQAPHPGGVPGRRAAERSCVRRRNAA